MAKISRTHHITRMGVVKRNPERIQWDLFDSRVYLSSARELAEELHSRGWLTKIQKSIIHPKAWDIFVNKEIVTYPTKKLEVIKKY